MVIYRGILVFDKSKDFYGCICYAIDDGVPFINEVVDIVIFKINRLPILSWV